MLLSQNNILSNAFESVVGLLTDLHAMYHKKNVLLMQTLYYSLISQSFLFQNKWGAKRLSSQKTPVISYVSPQELRKRSQQYSQISQN